MRTSARRGTSVWPPPHAGKRACIFRVIMLPALAISLAISRRQHMLEGQVAHMQFLCACAPFLPGMRQSLGV